MAKRKTPPASARGFVGLDRTNTPQSRPLPPTSDAEAYALARIDQIMARDGWIGRTQYSASAFKNRTHSSGTERRAPFDDRGIESSRATKDVVNARGLRHLALKVAPARGHIDGLFAVRQHRDHRIASGLGLAFSRSPSNETTADAQWPSATAQDRRPRSTGLLGQQAR
ncbi:MAG: hypothetical protein DMF84_26805 [Acidobacteria bacterium]|nr:MAG: hypothetical protein DMF84_26805 [Acidobacteriota bacterium]